MIFLFVLGFTYYDATPDDKCVIDRCESEFCIVETPEGNVEVDRKPYYYEGKKIECPIWLIDPT